MLSYLIVELPSSIPTKIELPIPQTHLLLHIQVFQAFHRFRNFGDPIKFGHPIKNRVIISDNQKLQRRANFRIGKFQQLSLLYLILIQGYTLKKSRVARPLTQETSTEKVTSKSEFLFIYKQFQSVSSTYLKILNLRIYFGFISNYTELSNIQVIKWCESSNHLATLSRWKTAQNPRI